MDLVFKKYFWVINLAALGVLAFFVASGVNEMVASKLFAVPKANVKGGAAIEGKAPRLGRLATNDEPRKALLERLIFDLDPKEIETPPEKTDTDTEPAKDAKPEGEFEES